MQALAQYVVQVGAADHGPRRRVFTSQQLDAMRGLTKCEAATNRASASVTAAAMFGPASHGSATLEAGRTVWEHNQWHRAMDNKNGRPCPFWRQVQDMPTRALLAA